MFTRISRIRYIEYGTERSPAKLTRPTFNELYEPKKLMFNVLGELTGTIDTEKLVHNHSLIACVLGKIYTVLKTRALLLQEVQHDKP